MADAEGIDAYPMLGVQHSRAYRTHQALNAMYSSSVPLHQTGPGRTGLQPLLTPCFGGLGILWRMTRPRQSATPRTASRDRTPLKALRSIQAHILGRNDCARTYRCTSEAAKRTGPTLRHGQAGAHACKTHRYRVKKQSGGYEQARQG
jgi:hypothetical protein